MFILGYLGMVYLWVYYGAIATHIILAIITSSKILKSSIIEDSYTPLFTTWFIPIFGSLVVRKKENL